MTRPTNAQKFGAPVQLNGYCQGCSGGPRALYAVRVGKRVIAKRCGECMTRIGEKRQTIFEQRHKKTNADT